MRALLARVQTDGFDCPTCGMRVVLTLRGTFVVHGDAMNAYRCPRSGERPDDAPTRRGRG